MTGDPAIDLVLVKALSMARQPIVGNHPLVESKHRFFKRLEDALVTHTRLRGEARKNLETECNALFQAHEELRALERGEELLR